MLQDTQKNHKYYQNLMPNKVQRKKNVLWLVLDYRVGRKNL